MNYPRATPLVFDFHPRNGPQCTAHLAFGCGASCTNGCTVAARDFLSRAPANWPGDCFSSLDLIPEQPSKPPEAPPSPGQSRDGTFPCVRCQHSFATAAQWRLHRAAVHGARLPPAVFPEASSTDEFRQHFRGALFRRSREGYWYELTAQELHELVEVVLRFRRSTLALPYPPPTPRHHQGGIAAKQSLS